MSGDETTLDRSNGVNGENATNGVVPEVAEKDQDVSMTDLVSEVSEGTEDTKKSEVPVSEVSEGTEDTKKTEVSEASAPEVSAPETTESKDESKDETTEAKNEPKEPPAKRQKTSDESSTPASTPASKKKPTPKDSSASKKDARISTFFAATPTKSKNGSSTPATPASATPKAKPASSTPLKLRLKTKPTLPALTEDNDEENPSKDQLNVDDDSIENHPDIAFCVMFRTRFTDLFDGWCPPLCPQDFEEGVQPEEGFSHAVESYLVRVMSLMMNRKKPVEVGKYSNALETWSTMPLAQGSVSTIDAMSLPCGWSRKLASRDVVAMDWRGRLQLLKMATVAALSLSDAIKKLIADKREVSGRKVLSELQWLPIGEDRQRNTYWLADGSGDINWDDDGKIYPATEGAFDTQWRLYRQTNPYKAVVSWTPVASSPEEIATLIEELPAAEGGKQPYTPLLEALHNKLVSKLEDLIPRTLGSRDRIKEAAERAVAQQQKKAAAARAQEYQKSKVGTNRGRTRGKRVDYKQLAAPADSEEEYELKEEEAIAQGHRRTGRTRAPAQEVAYEDDDFEATPSPEPEADKPQTPRNADGKRIRYVEKEGGGRRGKGWVYVVEEEIE